jgi:Outer membrane lipoprotein carrier protein LolA-like
LSASLLTSAVSGATPDADALIVALARPAPSTVAFTEVRFSPLLRNALIVSGELGYSGPANLDRRIRQPYREDTSIRGEAVRVEREGAPPRSFALRRAPELRGLLDGFSALLAGDAATIKRRFDIAVAGEEDNWRLELTPRDAGARQRLQQIVVVGAANTPRCFSMMYADSGSSVMLLGDAAQEPVAADVTPEVLQQRCESGIGSRESGVLHSTSGGGNHYVLSHPGASPVRSPNSRLPIPDFRPARRVP